MKEQKRLKNFEEFSHSSKSICCKLKNNLNEHSITIDQKCDQILKDKYKFIDMKGLSALMVQLQIKVSNQEIEVLFDELKDPKTGKLSVDKLDSLINNIQDSTRGRDEQFDQEILYIFQKADNLIELISTIKGDKGGLTQKNLNQLLAAMNYNNRQKQQKFIRCLLNGKEVISIEDFIRDLNLSKRPAKIFQYKKINRVQSLEQFRDIYFNPLHIGNQQLEQTIITCVKQQKAFIDKFNPKYSKMTKFYDISKMDYNLFQRRQSNLSSKEKILMENIILPGHVIQGQVSSCYFLSAMASLAQEFSWVIQRLFIIFKNDYGIYAVRLFIDGEWKTVQIDTHFPTNETKQFCGARPFRPLNMIIWPMLIEKAFAKINGSYDKIEWGSNYQGIQYLTDAPSFTCETQYKGFLQIVQRQCKRGSILTCENGRHSFSLLKVITNVKDSDNNTVTLFKIRDPLRKFKWFGAWSVQSTLWTSDLLEQCKYQLNPKDGSFFMCQNDFVKFFPRVNICRMVVENKNESIDLQCENGKFKAVCINIQEDGVYSFTIYLKNRRVIKKEHPQYQRWGWMFLFKKENYTHKQVNCSYMQKENNKIFCEQELKVGEYILISRSQWSQERKQQYVLTSYGPQKVEMELGQGNHQQFIQKFIEYDLKSIVRIPFCCYQKIGVRHRLDPQKGYGFIEIQNLQDYSFEITIIFEQKYKQIHFIYSKRYVKPNSQQNIKFLVNSNGIIIRTFLFIPTTVDNHKIRIRYQSIGKQPKIKGQSKPL